MKPINPNEVIEWAESLLIACDRELTLAERAEQQKYAALIQNPSYKVFLSRLLDESSQVRDRKKLARRVKELIDTYGVPQFFSSTDQSLLKLYKHFGYLFDFIAIPIFKKRLREETSSIIIDEERPHLTKHLTSRYSKGVGQNINLLGEIVVGDAEADRRYDHYLNALKEPDINYISIKISGIYAQLHPLNFTQARRDLIERLSAIFRAAIKTPYINERSQKQAKFVNLDMEEYKDAHLTLDVFKATLEQPEFKHFTAGLVIQTYLPDAELFLLDLLEFSHDRVKKGGAPLKVRLVKGANQQMESVISSLRGWENPVRTKKVDSDAAYLRLIDIAMRPENARVLHIGIASHNLFSIAYAFLTATNNGVTEFVSFEMLEGMANNLWRAMLLRGAKVILYTPVVKDKHFLNAVSYLVRRLDENTGKENFLSYSFNLETGSEEWEFLKQQFQEAYNLRENVSKEPTRTQDRNQPSPKTPSYDGSFSNEPDTNFDMEANKRWAESIVAAWSKPKTTVIPLQIGSAQILEGKRYSYTDRVQANVVSYEMVMANDDAMRQILQTADKDVSKWSITTLSYRHEILRRTADLIAARRGDLIGAMCAVTSKTIVEGDVEISEAVDFCRFYPHTMEQFTSIPNINYTPQGVVLVISPWNFPLAIPVGGVAAALAAGNRVILKPSTVAAPIMWEAVKCFWEAGVPKDALQIVITDGRAPLQQLTQSPVISHIVLTGGTETAQRLTNANPRVRLSAETGGKNAIILTSHGDRDKAIMNAVTSAFGNAGQKCSACSLFLVESDVYDDPSFREKLKDAAQSMQTGSPWKLNNIVGPMIDNNNDKLLQSINNPNNAERWLIEPKFLDSSGYILSPTILWDVKPTDFEFETELFAPLLSVVRFETIDQAISMVNGSAYGLTSGLQSLHEGEIKQWMNKLEAGNLYINRGITGAIVNRQPFGGMKLSAFGGGIKAGGVNYVSRFANFTTTATEDDYEKAYESEFAHTRDVNNLYGEQNLFRYLPLRSMILRVLSGDKREDIMQVAKAAKIAKTPLVLSIERKDERIKGVDKLCCRVVEQTQSVFLKEMSQYDRVRTLRADIPMSIYEAAAANNQYIATDPPIACGRIELLHYLQEQSISYEYHRYGSIVEPPRW